MHFEQKAKQTGYVLLVTLGLTTVGAVLMGGALVWSAQNAALTDRNAEFFTTSYAAEAATEKVLSSVTRDYKNYGEGLVYSKIGTYSSTVPSSADNQYWSAYRFNNGASVNDRLFMDRVNPTNYVLLGPPYQGLHAFASTYQIIANAKNVNSIKKIPGAVGQEVNLGTIPIFQFAIFYEEDLEINPGPVMNVRGLVHGNRAIYLEPQATLTFSNDISASESIVMNKKPGDPTSRTVGTVNFLDYHLSNVSPLNLPVGTNTTGSVGNTADNVRAILEIPPIGESPYSETGTNRLYNKADMILLVSNDVVSVKSGIIVDNSATIIPTNQWKLFLKTNSNFYNKRELVNVQGTTIDVNALRQWSLTNTLIRPALGGREVSSVYVADMRPTSNAVVMTNITVNTNFTFITNTTPTTALAAPAAGTYVGTVNNTSVATNSPPPKPSTPPAMNVVTNTTYTTNNYSQGAPAAGTYVGTVTTSGSGSNKKWRYYKITSYSYSLPAYVYNKITSTITNTSKTTNFFYSTNFTIFAQSGVVLTNGRTLPSQGFTVVTPNPLYIMGDYNTSLDGVTFYPGTSDTSKTRPAAVMADAIMILSTAWDHADSSSSISSRVAANTTVNAAILSGIVPTGGGYYSGGVENFPRFLENWSGRTFTYNGSMVCMFNSDIATAPWGGNDVYNPPNRNWAFDNNYMDPRKLPPLTPQVISVTRGKWSLITPNTTRF